MSLSKDVISISSGLPLDLEVIGSLLYGMDIEAWKDKMSKLKTIPAGRVQEKLMISYEALEDDEKEIFLDIACFFIYEEKSYPMYMWEACGFGPNWAVPVHLSMSLVKITDDNKFWMYDQLRDLGREIVHIKGCNSPSPREGIRIQKRKDALCVLERKKEKEVVGIDQYESLDTLTDFTSFESLRFLQVRKEMALDTFGQLPHNLRWLSLRLENPNFFADLISKFSFVLQSWSSSYLIKLVILELQYSSITDHWEGWIPIQEIWSLKVLDLTGCSKLTRTPNFSKMVDLEKLILRGCKRLAKIDSSIGKLRKLKYLNLEGCYGLQELQKEVGNLEYLEHFIMTGTKVSKLPDSIGELKYLEVLSLRGCEKLKKLPESIRDIWSLVHLDISSFSRLKELPESIGRLVKLEHLSLHYCVCMKKLPDSVGDLISLVSLDLSSSGLRDELTSSVTRLTKLQRLSLSFCEKIVKLPGELGNLESLVELDLSCTDLIVIPETVAQLSLLQKLNLSGCDGIGRFPQLPTSLTDLKLRTDSIQNLVPDLSELVHLRTLNLFDSRLDEDGGCGSPQLEPFKFDAIRNLSRLEDLVLALDNLTSLPTEFSALTRLKTLKLRCPNLKCATQFPSSLQRLTLDEVGGETELPCLSNLNNLSELVFEDCWMEGGMFRSLGVEMLESLTTLKVYSCGRIDIFPDLSQLKCLDELEVRGCKKLAEIPGLGKLVSLKQLSLRSVVL